ncbi:hypothetical protein HED48_23385 [Ochrobactrum intermedium]|nr:hypothetical protein [Brucella intermedia]
MKRFGKQLGRVTPAQLRALAVAALRDISKPDGNPPRPERSKRFSIADDSFSTVNRANVREAADAVRGRLTDWTPKALALVPLNYFTELAQKGPRGDRHIPDRKTPA